MFESYKSKFYCFDNSDVKLMNDNTSATMQLLSIYYDMPTDACDLKDDEVECIPKAGIRKKMLDKYALLL